MQPLSGVTLLLVALSHGKILAGELKVPASLRSSSAVGFCNRSSESAEPAAKTQDMRACGCQNLNGSVCESLQRRSRSFWVYEEKQRVATASVRWLRGVFTQTWRRLCWCWDAALLCPRLTATRASSDHGPLLRRRMKGAGKLQSGPTQRLRNELPRAR